MANSKVFLVFALVFLCPAVYVQRVSSVGQAYYWITLTPTSSGLVYDGRNGWLHPVAESNVSVSYQVQWGWGDKNGQKVVNASVYLEIREDNGTMIENHVCYVNDTGYISFYHKSQGPETLHFVPTKVVDQEGIEYNSTLLHQPNTAFDEYWLYGLNPSPITVYWDSLNIASINAGTNDLGTATVVVQVQYLIIPEDSQLYPKNINTATVTVNGLNATVYQDGFYTVTLTTWYPTVDLTVEASFEGWPKTTKTYSTAQIANRTLYFQIAAAILVTLGILAAVYAISRRRKHKERAK